MGGHFVCGARKGRRAYSPTNTVCHGVSIHHNYLERPWIEIIWERHYPRRISSCFRVFRCIHVQHTGLSPVIRSCKHPAAMTCKDCTQEITFTLPPEFIDKVPTVNITSNWIRKNVTFIYYCIKKQTKKTLGVTEVRNIILGIDKITIEIYVQTLLIVCLFIERFTMNKI